jgi:hypothetical protein
VEALRVLSPLGALYISAPSNGVYHAHPTDCWRFYPDSGIALVRWAGRAGYSLDLIESFIAPRSQDGWEDMVMVFGKGRSWPTSIHGQLPGHRDLR